MPTFRTGESTPTTWGTFLLPVPFVAWFNDSVLSALAEMSMPGNWATEDIDKLREALGYANEMQARFKLLNFNPFPVGMIFPFGGTVAPDGYLACDGSSYDTTDYPELFAQIGYYYGGSGSTFFVPNLYNRVVVGSGDDYSIGDMGGQNDVTLTIGEMPTHSHISDAPTVIDPTHSHVEGTTLPTAITIGAGVPAPSALPSVGTTAPSATGISVLAPNINDTGGGGPHENRQPFLATLYVIYAGRQNA